MADGIAGFHLTSAQLKAQSMLASIARYLMLFGGSRSGKTFLLIRSVVLRALKAPNSRHAVFRFRLAHIKSSIVAQTFPDVMRKCFPDVDFDLNKGELYATLSNGSEIWFGGLDDKDRTEKILGMEFVTLYFNECSQIPWTSIEIALTRLAQRIEQTIGGMLVARAYFDCNPPNKAHWTYKLFIKKIHPETGKPLVDPLTGLTGAALYDAMRMNPSDNAENLEVGYLASLQAMSPRNRKRFWEGEFADANPDALFPEEKIDGNRLTSGEPPDMVKIVVAVDPSGSKDYDNAQNDAIGIVVAGLGTDGKGYLLEDLTIKAGPGTWGRVAVEAFIRHEADTIVYESNFGGAMVEMVLKAAARELDCKPSLREVKASRGKVVRAEPIGQLYEEDKVVHVGYLLELEDELSNFTTHGFVGDRSPNRADAAIWALTHLFPRIIGKKKNEKVSPRLRDHRHGPELASTSTSWMN
jgi:phage terminase large subunit-like protein